MITTIVESIVADTLSLGVWPRVGEAVVLKDTRKSGRGKEISSNALAISNIIHKAIGRTSQAEVIDDSES